MVDTTAARIDTVLATPPFSRISWGSIFAGTLCAFALQLLFNLVGLGLGLATVDISEGTDAFSGIGMGAGIWWGVSAIISLAVGGWIAGRLAGVPIRLTAALHGASVWALATLLTVWLATTTLSTAVSGAFGAVGQIGQATASAVTGIATGTDEIAEGSPLLTAQRTGVTEAGQQRQSVMRSIREEARELFRQVVSQQQQQQAETEIEETAREILRSPGDIGQDLNALVDRLFAQGGVFSEEDREEAIDLIQQRLGISDEEAQEIVANWEERYQAAVAQVDEALETLRQEAVATAQQATDAVAVAAAWTSVALALGLLAAVIGGMLGKPDPWMVEAIEEEERERERQSA